jgi:hypothetical protein
VRYLYPEINDVRIEAEYLACLSYLATQRNLEAKQLYEAISNELSAARKAELAAKLQGIE